MASDDNSIDLSPGERDLAIRTIYGEAGTEPPIGQAGVASVIKNRLRSKIYGSDLSSVILAPKQFSVWNRGDPGGAAARGLDPNSDTYAKIGDIVDGVMKGNIADPTGGAGSYYNPRAANPNWGPTLAKQNDVQLGNHRFVGRIVDPQPAATAPDAIASAIGAPTAPSTSKGPGDMAPMAFTASGGPAAASGGTPSLEDMAKELDVDPSVLKTAPAAPAAAASTATSAAASTPSMADMAKELEIDPSVLKTPGQSATGVVSPLDRINQAAAALGVPATATMQEKALAVANATRGKQSELEGRAAAAGSPYGSVQAAAGGVVSGIPIAGPGLMSGLQHGAAGLRSIINGTPYQDELNFVRGVQSQSDTEHPGLATVGNVAGGVAGYGVAAAAGGAPVATALGLEGPLAQRVILGGLTNAGIGGTDAYIRGENPATGAVLGGSLGAGAPAAGKVLGEGAQFVGNKLAGALGNRIPGMPSSAVKFLTKALEADNPANVQSEASRLGDQAMLGDLGPSLLGVTQGAALKPGAPKSIIYNALTDRAAGANARMRDAVASAMGPGEDPEVVTAGILKHADAVNKVNYGQALGNAPPVDTSNVIGLIDNQLATATGAQKKALEFTRSSLLKTTADGLPPSPIDNAQILHNIKGDMDSVINYGTPGLGVEAGAVRRQQGSLKMIRGALNDALENQVPGYKNANDTASELFRQAEAVKEGTDLLGAGKSTQWPSTFANDYAQRSPGVQAALNKGTRGSIEASIGTKPNDVSAVTNMLQGENGWNTQKLATQFGQQPINKLVNVGQAEKRFADTTQNVVYNSQSAQRLAAQKLLEDTNPETRNYLSTQMTGMIVHGLNKFVAHPVINALFHPDNVARDVAIANAVTAQGAARDATINNLAKAVANLQRGSSAANAAGRGVRSGTNLLLPVYGQYKRQKLQPQP